jgi:hypothetical protein
MSYLSLPTTRRAVARREVDAATAAAGGRAIGCILTRGARQRAIHAALSGTHGGSIAAIGPSGRGAQRKGDSKNRRKSGESQHCRGSARQKAFAPFGQQPITRQNLPRHALDP